MVPRGQRALVCAAFLAVGFLLPEAARAATLYSQPYIGESYDISFDSGNGYYAYYFEGATLANPPENLGYWVSTGTIKYIRFKLASGTCPPSFSFSTDTNGTIGDTGAATFDGTYCLYEFNLWASTGPGTQFSYFYTIAEGGVGTAVLDGSSSNGGIMVNGFNSASRSGGPAFELCDEAGCDGVFTAPAPPDTDPPSAQITSAETSVTNAASITLTITWSETVTGFTLEDLAITGATVTGFSGSGASYTAEVSPAADGVVSVTVASGGATDASGNTSTEATFSFTSDRTAPTLQSIEALASGTDTTPSLTLSTSEEGTLTLTGSCETSTATVAVGNTTITLNELVLGTYSDCAVVVTDAAGNASAPLSLGTFTISAEVVEAPEPESSSERRIQSTGSAPRSRTEITTAPAPSPALTLPTSETPSLAAPSTPSIAQTIEVTLPTAPEPALPTGEVLGISTEEARPHQAAAVFVSEDFEDDTNRLLFLLAAILFLLLAYLAWRLTRRERRN